MPTATTAKMYGQAVKSAFEGKINIVSDTIKVMLVTSSYTLNQDTDIYVSSVRASELIASGYTAGGFTLASKTSTYDGTSNTYTFDATDLANILTNFTGTFRYLVIYDDTPATDVEKPLIACQDFGSDQTATSGNVSITWATSGIFTASCS